MQPEVGFRVSGFGFRVSVVVGMQVVLCFFRGGCGGSSMLVPSQLRNQCVRSVSP